jgi:hypothetical protein
MLPAADEDGRKISGGAEERRSDTAVTLIR